MSEWLTPSPHEAKAACFERKLEELKWQHAFPLTTRDRAFLEVEWSRLHRLDEIDKISAWAERKGMKKLLRLARFTGDRADQASALFAQFQVCLTASDRRLIDALIPKITSEVLSCGGTPGQHSLDYQPLEEGGGMPGYWMSEGTHIFES